MVSMFRIDAESSTPPFEQLRMRLLEQIGDGSLAAGSRLPPVRGLAEELGLAPGTVARAYRELEADGVIETRGRHGSFVAAHGSPAQRLAQEAASVFAARIRELGVAPGEGLELARRALSL